jgi:hypothetical protein
MLAFVIVSYHSVSFDYDARQYYSLVESMLQDGDLDTHNQGLLHAPVQFPPGFSFLVAPVAAVLDGLGPRRKHDLLVDDVSEMVPEARIPMWNAMGSVYRLYTGRGFDADVHGSYMTAFAITSLLMFALGLAANAKLLRPGQGWVPVLLAIGSPMVLYNATSYLLYSSLTALGLSSIALLLHRTSESRGSRLLACGAACGALLLIRYEMAIVPAAFVVAALVERRPREAWAIVLGAAPFILLLLAYNSAVFGNPFAMSYEAEKLNEFTISPQRLAWYLWDLRSGLLVYSTLAVVSLLGLWRERNRVYLAIPLVLLAIYLLRINPRTDVETAGLDINRYFLVLIPYSSLGLGQLVTRFGWRAWAPAATIAAVGLATFFSLFPFRDRHHLDHTPITRRLARESNLYQPRFSEVAARLVGRRVYRDGREIPASVKLFEQAVIFHKYAGYYGFYSRLDSTWVKGMYFDNGSELIVIRLRRCLPEEGRWAATHSGTCARPF